MSDFGDRMKMYEGLDSKRMMPGLPICVRLDGKAFSRWTKDLARPYDVRLSDLMLEVTKILVDRAGALVGYTQSDEISLILYSDNPSSQVYFDGKLQKLVSVLPALASVHFYDLVRTRIPEKEGSCPVFDCRIWNMPTLDEAANAILWREQDATKNSIQSATRSVYSHNEVHGKNTSEMQDMLFEKGINWNDYPDFFKRGSFVQRRKVTRVLTVEELEELPPMHNARKNPKLEFERTEMRVIAMPPFSQVTNRVGVIFHGEEPKTSQE